MSDKLKDFISANRQELDTFEPSANVWKKIGEGMKKAPPKAGTGGVNGWWKYAIFGASVLAVIVYFSGNEQPEGGTQETAGIALVDTASLNTERPAAEPVRENSAPVRTLPASGRTIAAVAPVDDPGKIDSRPAPTASLPEYQTGTPAPEIEPVASPPAGQPAPTEEQPAPPADPVSSPRHESKEETKQKRNEFHTAIDTTFNGIKKVVVNGSYIDVNVKQHPGDQLTVKGEINITARGLHSKIGRDYRIECTRKDSVLNVSVACKSSRNSFFVVGSLIIDAVINLDLPETATGLQIVNSSGDVAVSGFTGKEMDIQTSSGDVNAADIHAMVTLRASSGDVTVKRIRGDIESYTSSGNQRFEDLTGGLHASASSGDINVNTLQGDAVVKSSSGYQDFEQVTGHITASSSSGDIKIRQSKGNVFISTTSGYIKGKKVDLENDLQLASSSGDIEMDLVNHLDDLSFDLKSSSGDLRIDKNGQVHRAEDNLFLKTGPIRVKGRTTSGDQSFR